MSLLESFIECCEHERENLRLQLAGLESTADQRELERLKRSISDLDSIIEASPEADFRRRSLSRT